MTCGTPEKRAFLLEAFPGLEDDHIGDSRSTSFEVMVRMLTKGAGVHLALNSLADDKLQVRQPLPGFSACRGRSDDKATDCWHFCNNVV